MYKEDLGGESIEHYIVSTGKMEGTGAKIALLKNIYSCNTVYVDEVVVSKFSLDNLEIVALKNIESAGAGAVSKKGISTDFSNGCFSKSTLYYNDSFVDTVSQSDIVFNEIEELGNVRIKFENPIILKPCNSLAILLKLDDTVILENATSFTASVRFSFDETNSCACCYCC